MKVVVIGAGYVGLVAAACLAKSGHEVACVERDKSKLDMLNSGRSPIYEPGLEQLLARGLASGRLRFFETLSEFPIQDINVFMIAVGTPSTERGRVDLSFVMDAIRDIVMVNYGRKNPAAIIMKSTVPPGTGNMIKCSYLADQQDALLYVANPEFLREGNAISDWYNPDRIVVGTETEKGVELMIELYSDISAPMMVMDIASAEMVKYASNAFLAMKISFINEIANLCEYVNADIDKVAPAIGADKRIGPDFLKPGVGYGGSCFSKDTRALDFFSNVNGYSFQLLKATIEVNSRQRLRVIQKLRASLGNLFARRIAILGLTFKPNTDDVRESPSLDIIPILIEAGAQVRAYDPLGLKSARSLLPLQVRFAQNMDEALSGANAAVLLTDWVKFQTADWKRLRRYMDEPALIVDGRNVLDAQMMKSLGYEYRGIGRTAH